MGARILVCRMAAGWPAPVFPCVLCPGKELPQAQSCLLPLEIKGLVSLVDVLLWHSCATGAGLCAAARMSLSPVRHGLVKCHLSLRACDKREVRWWPWEHWTNSRVAPAFATVAQCRFTPISLCCSDEEEGSWLPGHGTDCVDAQPPESKIRSL